MDTSGGEKGTTIWFGLGGLAISTLLGVLALAAASELGSMALAAASAQLLAGGLVWLAIFMEGFYSRRASAERLEASRLDSLAQEGRQRLFEGVSAPEALARQALDRFERVGGVVLALLLGVAELLLAWSFWSLFARDEPPQGRLSLAALACGASFALLLLGRYGFALARAGLPAAAAGGRRATAAALITFVAGVTLAVVHSFGLTQLDLLGYAFLVGEGVLGLEAFLLVLLEAYRPRRAGVRVRPPYDSRLLGVLSSPKDIARSIARAVDYQFGFGLSQTWFYRFLERWVVPLVLFAVFSFWLLSAVVVVRSHEEALVRRLGRTRGQPLGAGIHLKLPWPLERVLKFDRSRVQRLVTGSGHVAHEDVDTDSGAREETILWSHAKVEGQEDLVLLARSVSGGSVAEGVNLLAVSATIHYRLEDVSAHVSSVSDPLLLLELLAERELSFMLSSADLDGLLRERGSMGQQLRQRLQRAVQAQGLALEILGAELTDLHPPVEVGRSFEAVTGALEERERLILAARGRVATLLPRAETEAAAMRLHSRVDAENLVELAEAEVAELEALVALDRAAPGVFRQLRLLEELVLAGESVRKVVVTRPGVTVDLNLEDVFSLPDMPSLGLGSDESGQDGDGR